MLHFCGIFFPLVPLATIGLHWVEFLTYWKLRGELRRQENVTRADIWGSVTLNFERTVSLIAAQFWKLYRDLCVFLHRIYCMYKTFKANNYWILLYARIKIRIPAKAQLHRWTVRSEKLQRNNGHTVLITFLFNRQCQDLLDSLCSLWYDTDSVWKLRRNRIKKKKVLHRMNSTVSEKEHTVVNVDSK